MTQSTNWHAAARKLQVAQQQQSQAKSDHAAGIVAAAQKQVARPQANTAGKADDKEVIASLKSMGAIGAEQPDSNRADRLMELPGRVRLEGFEQETEKQKAASDGEVIASLRALGVIGDEEDQR